MARLSPRSIVAVCTFMMSAFATASLVAPDNELLSSGTAWLRTDTVPVLHDQWRGFGVSMFIVIPSLYVLYNVLKVGRSVTTGAIDSSSIVNEEKQLEEHPTNHASDSSSGEGDVEAVNLPVTSNGGYGSAANSKTSQPSAPAEDECNDIDEQCCDNTTSDGQTKTLTDQDKIDSVRKLLPSTLGSMLFSIGLAVSQMVLPSKVLGFLNLFTISKGTYDPTLLTVMIGGCIISMISYQFIDKFSLVPKSWTWMPRLTKPITTSKFCVPTSNAMDMQLVGGAFCFGIGWAVAGLCPGPAIFLFASGAIPVIRFWWPTFLVGSFIAGYIKEFKANH
jgi:uncharacterized protein